MKFILHLDHDRLTFILPVIFFACSSPPESIPKSQAEGKFTLVDSGIDFANTITETDSSNVIFFDYMCNGDGVAAGDVDNVLQLPEGGDFYHKCAFEE